LQELCQLAYVVGRAYLSLALSLGVLLVVPKAIGDKEHEYWYGGLWAGALLLLGAALSGTGILLTSVLQEDLSAAWAGLRHNLKDEPGFSPIGTPFTNARKRLSTLLDLTRAAAALGLRSAQAKLKQVETSAWKRGARPIIYVAAGYLVAQWLSLCAQGRIPSGYGKIDRMTAVFLRTVIKYTVLALAATTLLKAIGCALAFVSVYCLVRARGGGGWN